MKRISETHQLEQPRAIYDPGETTESPRKILLFVSYEPDTNISRAAIWCEDGPLPDALLPVGAPEGCHIVRTEAVVSGRLRELGAARAAQIAEYVVGHLTTVCNPGHPEQPGFTPRYDFPQSGAPSFLRSCAIESCGVLAEAPEGSFVAGNTEDEVGDEPPGDMT